ncbi:MAG: carboxylesterase family protein [Paracoccus sp. (in: a-proteobacteria)]|nr:carboxylesterase family protein [Paracoccus sp. (in: a-proteobacteria)]
MAQAVFDAPAGLIIAERAGLVLRARGIPYAIAERWQRPRPAPSSERAIEARRPSNACPQLPIQRLDAALPSAFEGIAFDEDCTQLSVTRPASEAAGLPVMVWIHGGSYEAGAADMAVFDPSAIAAEEEVIVVAVSYRLGVFGWLGGDGRPANLGLLDLIDALRWVQRNISAFGGNAGNVTLFGQSSGGDAIAKLMLAEPAQGLFHRAIIQSAPLELQDRAARMRAAMRARMKGLGEGASTAELLAAQARISRAARRFGLPGFMPFGPEFGAAPLPRPEARAAAHADAAPRVDLLVGHTETEAALFLPPSTGWPARMADPARRLAVAGLTRRLYSGPARRFAEAHAAAGGRAARFVIHWGQGAFGSAHLAELPLLFPSEAWIGSPLVAAGTTLDTLRAEGKSLRALWAGFARDGRIGRTVPGLVTITEG